MIRILFSIALLPTILLAHETGGIHLHPHGAEWLPALVLACALSGIFYLIQRFARR